MLMWPSAVLKTPVGMLVGWLLPACPGTSPAIEPARGLEVEHEDLRLQQRGVHPLALAGCLALEQRDQDALGQRTAAGERSAIGMPTRTGPWPGRPVIDMSPPMPCAIWSKPGRLA